jgi:YhcH/YjgK/YiaL family protein
MTVTEIKSPDNIIGLHPLIAKAAEEMKKLFEADAPVGKYEIEGDRLFINIMSYETSVYENCMFENHKDYIDVQMMMEGEEDIGFITEDKLTVKTPYTPDVALFYMEKPEQTVRISPGVACIILPPEPHAPCMAVDNIPKTVKKMVAKIKL